MRNRTLLALALLLAASLPGLTAADPLPQPGPAAPSGPDPLALCAASPATAPQALPPNPVTELGVGATALTCSAYCGHPQCLGQPVGEFCLLGPGKVGTCIQSTLYCSTDGIKRCSCIQEPA